MNNTTKSRQWSSSSRRSFVGMKAKIALRVVFYVLKKV